MKNGKPGGSQFGPDLSDLLNQMFGGGIPTGAGMSGGWGRRSPDAVQTYKVSLEELYAGKHVKLMSKRKVVCASCKG